MKIAEAQNTTALIKIMFDFELQPLALPAFTPAEVQWTTRVIIATSMNYSPRRSIYDINCMTRFTGNYWLLPGVNKC